jgi:Ca2+-binding RTX toxin-like protein
MHIDGHGNTLANTITGTVGNNLLDGAAGADSLSGLDGDDVYIVDNGGDLVIEALAAGTDEVFAMVSHTLAVNVEYLTLGGSAAINGAGNSLDNRLIGNDAGNKLSGGAGDDLLMGYAGNDRLAGGVGADTLKGGSGDDTYEIDSSLDSIVEASTLASEIDTVLSLVDWTLGANLENLTLLGTNAVDGTGNSLRNTLLGNGAANVLDGGAGFDTLTGGAGADTFRFSSALGALKNIDRITDFSVVDDRIQLENGIFKALVNVGALSAGSLRAGANVTTAADANDFLLYNSSTGALYYDADGSGAGASAIQFATLSVGLALTAADFTIF